MNVVKVQRRHPWEGEIEAMKFEGTPPDATNAEEIMEWVRSYGVEIESRLTNDDDLELIVDNGTARSMGTPGHWLMHTRPKKFWFMNAPYFERHYGVLE
jgi:hypothetical protein